MTKILVVEDDHQIQQELVLLLQRNGFEAQALTSFESVPQQIIAAHPDLVLLDLNLPGIDGQQICREVRQLSNVPIIVVTSRNTDLDELMVLSLGADDFIAKPYNTQILLMHITSVLRRANSDVTTGTKLSHAGVTLDSSSCKVSANQKSVELTKNELRILSLLMQNAGTVVSRQRIQEELWQSDEFVDDNTLTVNISHLRNTLASIGVEDFVMTRRGLGYVIE
ncbi:MAG: response regulator transcription factor [Atopobium sp.]|jgi:two component transcriptional regulator, winged helix family|nr:response regulator transcription factor [Atopobium sp.]MBF0907831.1 response regulator transcription factor [Atopobium sp.]MBF0914392.1 response regulator transcription factor [Atopobium sp.]MBF0953719.1 response regulator transcription factor [Atopobium sp.]MBF0977972.1 response regulator transcription factor [Atopobium sp.]